MDTCIQMQVREAQKVGAVGVIIEGLTYSV